MTNQLRNNEGIEELGPNLLTADDELLEDSLFKSTKDFDLTKSEIQILTLIVAGRSNKQIAKLLCRSQRTVEYHRCRLMGKLNVNNTVDLVKCAIEMGIV